MKISFKVMVLTLLFAGRAFAQICQTNTATPTPLPICTLTPTAAATATPTSTPTNTPIPANTSTPTSTPTASAHGACLWNKQFGGTSGSDASEVYGVATDVPGNTYFGGRYQGNVNFGAGPLGFSGTWDGMLVKYSAAGNFIWAIRLGTAGTTTVRGVATDGSGNVLVAGLFQGTVNFGAGPVTAATTSVFVAKYNTSGTLQWVKVVTNGSATSVAADSSGDVAIAGFFGGTIDFGAGPLTTLPGSTNNFVAKYNSAGTLQWAKSYGGSGQDFANGVAIDSAGNPTVTGYFSGTADLGTGTLTSFGGQDIYVAKYLSASGLASWVKQIGSTGTDNGNAVAVDSSGNVLATGFFVGTVNFGGGSVTAGNPSGDVYVAKYDPSGTFILGNHYTGVGFNSQTTGQGIAADAAGNIVLTGTLNAPVDFGGGPLTAPSNSQDIFIAKFNSAGVYIFAKRAGGTFSDFGMGVAADGSNNTFGVGFFWTSANFGCGQMNSPGGTDGYLVKLAP